MVLSKKLQPNKIPTNSQGFPSTIMIDEVIRKMNPKDIMKENFYRNCHEINKINFLLRISKRLLEYILQNGEFFESKYVLISAIMLIKLAKVESLHYY